MLGFRVSAAIRAMKFAHATSALIIARAIIWVAQATLRLSTCAPSRCLIL
jgi:hypothetical protein